MSQQGLNQDRGVAAVLEMSKRRGLHASLDEIERAWTAVTVERESDRLAAVWRWVFAPHSAAMAPLNSVRNAQLPAWVIDGASVGIMSRIAEDGQPAEVEWLAGSSASASTDNWKILLPVAPLQAREEQYLKQPSKGAASEAIGVAMKAHSGVFAKAGLASIFINAVAIVSALFAMQVYDRVVPNFAFETLWFLASGVVLAFVLELLFKLVRMQLLESSEKRLDIALAQFFFERVLALKLDRRPAHVGALVAQVRDYEAVKAFFTASTLFVLADLPFIAIFIGVIYLIGGPVAWVPTVFVLASILVGIAVYRPIAKRQIWLNETTIRRQGLLFEAIAGTETVKGMGGEAQFGDTWKQATEATAMRGESLRVIDSSAQYVTQWLQQLAFVGVLVVGVYVAAAGNMTLGGLIACSILGGRSLSAISGITRLMLRWHHAGYALQILNQLLALPSDDGPDRQAHGRGAPLDLSVQDLAFSYGEQMMAQVYVPALSIAQGERVAIVGRNGSGKSTLLKLLAAVVTPKAGKIDLAHLDMQLCRPSWLRETIGYLPQEVRLFSGTLLDNLTLGLSQPQEADILAAMQATGLDQVVARHPDGLRLPIHEGGTGLSGGQKQLVVLTRLLLQKPKIWILDEPGASLDSESEARLMAILKDLPADTSLIFSTHRSQWLNMAERVLVVDAGQVRADEPREKIRAGSRATMQTEADDAQR